MIEPTLEVSGEPKPLSQLGKGDTENLLNILLKKLELAQEVNSFASVNQLSRFIEMVADRLQQFDEGMINDVAKEVSTRRLSILDDDF